MADNVPLEITVSRHFLSWLHGARISLAFTTYQTNRLFLIGLKPDGRLSAFERHFDRPMGLCAGGDGLYMSTAWQMWRLENVLPAGEAYNGYDRLYVPQCAWTTGELDVHDVAVDGGGQVVFANTLYNCLAMLSERYSFRPLWRPRFISQLVAEDRCHLNGLAMADGAPAYVTTVSRSDVVGGWRDRRASGGLVIDVEDHEIVIESLSMPHSPRLYRDALWLLNSGSGELGYVDRARGRFEPVAFCPGFLRGLAFAGDYAIIGLSKQRQERTFSGLALDDRLREKDADARCGLWVVDLRSGQVAHWLQLDGVVIELYDVAVLPGVRRPMALGFRSDEIRRVLTIDLQTGPLFQVLGGEATAVTDDARAGAAADAPQRAGSGAAPGRAAQPPAPALEGAVAEDYRRANQLAKDGRFGDAIPLYESVLAQRPDHANAWLNLGTCRHHLGDAEQALALYQRALSIDADSARAHANIASILHAASDLEGARQHYESARALEPDDPALANNLGLALYEAGRLDDAKRCFADAIRLSPRFAEAYNNLAGVLRLEEQHADALRLHEQAAALAPNLFEAHENIAKAYEEQARLPEADQAYRRALAIRDDPILALHHQLLCPPVAGSRAEIDRYRRRAVAVIDAFSGRELRLEHARVQSSRAEPPYEWAYQGCDNLPLKRAHAALFAPSFPAAAPLSWTPPADGPWHIGIVVTPAHEGVFLRCMSGIFTRLDARRFRVTVMGARPAEPVLRSAVRQSAARYLRLPLRFDHAVQQIRAARFDLLYFWEVGTDSSNHFLPFLRLAPVQCTGWGWPDASAAPELDYHLTARGTCDDDAQRFFSERLVALPHLPPYFFRPPIPERPPPRSHFGLRDDAHLYVCVQNLRKVHPDFDPLLRGILDGDPRAVAVFVADAHPAVGELLRRRWSETCAAFADRIVLLPRLQPRDYFSLLAMSDVGLDTLYFGGSNTAYDALAAGVPVVTLPTEQPRGRYTSAMYRAMGLDDCIAASAQEYVARALRLGTDATYRQAVSSAIRRQGDCLFENPRAVRQLEDFFAQVCREAAVHQT